MDPFTSLPLACSNTSGFTWKMEHKETGKQGRREREKGGRDGKQESGQGQQGKVN